MYQKRDLGERMESVPRACLARMATRVAASCATCPCKCIADLNTMAQPAGLSAVAVPCETHPRCSLASQTMRRLTTGVGRAKKLSSRHAVCETWHALFWRRSDRNLTSEIPGTFKTLVHSCTRANTTSPIRPRAPVDISLPPGNRLAKSSRSDPSKAQHAHAVCRQKRKYASGSGCR